MERSRNIVIGAIAGITATVAMTVAMDVLFRKLPPKDRYPLPPRELTERSTARLGLRGRLDEHDLQAATLLSHFGFGAVAGALYGCLAIPRKRATALLGIGYALAVWTVSYLGWVPGLALLRSATRHPPRRNCLMIAAHVVWGLALDLTARHLSSAIRPFHGGPLIDAPSRHEMSQRLNRLGRRVRALTRDRKGKRGWYRR